MLSQLRPALVLTVLLSAVTGLAYPLAITAAAQAALPRQANGSPLLRDGAVVGSDLVGQAFADPRFFWSRPSATAPDPYNAAASSGSNLGPTSRALVERTATAVSALGGAAPADAVTTSGSGLDPHISPAFADRQIDRVATARGLDPATVRQLVAEGTEEPLWGIFGEPRVNVLRLNLALDAAAPLGN